MGFNEHRIADPRTTPCDLASYAMNYCFHKGYIEKDAVRAMIVVAQMMDHPVPGNSKVIHGQLGLPRSTYCLDLYENCTGFISGLYTASSLLAASDMEEVILVTTDGGACYANIKDRNSYPLCGDAAAVTVVKKSSDPEDRISFMFDTDGSRREALLTPAGGRRMPYTEETAKLRMDEMGNYRSLNSLYMDGTAVFQFVMEEVPPLINEICRYCGLKLEDIEYHLTHQPNRFMLQKLADLLGVSRDILFNNIVEHFGNSSAVTIPLNIAFNLGQRLLAEDFLVCYSAFGAGLSLAAGLGRLGPLDFCELIEHPGNGAIACTGHGEYFYNR
jgi:3-oxoacyl-[acyl-carrier-protein] synthase-3